MKNTLRIFSLTLAAFTGLYASESSQGNITRRQVKSLSTNASTPEDHRTLAAYYEQEAQLELVKAQKAEQELSVEQAHPAYSITKNPNGRLNYFQYQMEHHQRAAERAQALVDLHRDKAGMASVSIARSSTATHNCSDGSCCARSGCC